jgi:bla regulator protein blaR1
MKTLTTIILSFMLFQAYSQELESNRQDSITLGNLPAALQEYKIPNINAPLYLLERKEIFSEEVAQIKPDDIESIQVLKGPSATEAFGARAANGVVIIKMKKPAYLQEQESNLPDVVTKENLPATSPAYGLPNMNAPLYLLERKEISSEDFSKIKPNDIESIHVLKGPSATEEFGKRGANGVVIISVKKPRFGPQKKLE